MANQDIREVTTAPVDIYVVPNLTHVLRFDLEEPSIFRYPELIEKPVEPVVLSLISRWLAQYASTAGGIDGRA
jgi:hypothetical protein